MLTEEEFVEATALYRRGWSISAIARHLGQAEAPRRSSRSCNAAT